MEKKLDAKEARVQIWEELLRVAKPDSKFSWQFSEFICDYEGSEKGTALPKKRVFFVCRKYYRCQYDRFRFYFTNLYIT